MTPFDDAELPFDILAPSAAMVPVVTGLRTALSELSVSDKTPQQAFAWDELPMVRFGLEAARHPILFHGFDPGEILEMSDPALREETLQYLSNDLGIMSEEDLKTHFHAQIEGARTAAHFRRIQEAPSVEDLLRNDIAIGWGRMEKLEPSPEERARTTRQRMFCDFFRSSVDWTRLRGWDVAQAAALITAALAVEMMTEKATLPYFERITGELLVRFANWHDFSRSLLTAEVFLALEKSEAAALLALRDGRNRLAGLLEGPWAHFPWPRIRTAA